jgi:hypothetical protein
MQINGLPSQPQRPDDGRRPADSADGPSFRPDQGRVDGPPSALPSRVGSESGTTGNASGDRLELSSAGRLMQPEQAPSASAERMEELKLALREGTLNSRERIELAARRILGDS